MAVGLGKMFKSKGKEYRREGGKCIKTIFEEDEESRKEVPSGSSNLSTKTSGFLIKTSALCYFFLLSSDKRGPQ